MFFILLCGTNCHKTKLTAGHNRCFSYDATLFIFGANCAYSLAKGTQFVTSHHIRSAVLSSFPEVISGLGNNPATLLEKAQIPADVFDDPETLISHTAIIRLLEESAAATGCEHLGLLLGQKTSLQNFGLLGLLVRSSASVQDAINVLIEHLNVQSGGVGRELHKDGNVAYIASIFEGPVILRSQKAIQISVTLTWILFGHLTKNQWNPTSIHFTFSQPSDKNYYRHFFDVPVVFNSDFDGVVFQAKNLDLKLPESDTFLHTEMKKQLCNQQKVSTNFISEVKRLIHNNLNVGIYSIDAVVQFFPFQKRTFQLKLKRLGISYQEILDEVRFQKAELHLSSSDITISQLAELLCYRSVSVFSTAFKNKYGVSPSVWKEKHRSQED